MAKRKHPTEVEFKIGDNSVVHTPTGATWTATPGSTSFSHYRPAMLGSVLSNGDDYRESEVRDMAEQLFKTRS